MLTAVSAPWSKRFKLQGERLGDVAAGAVIKHSRDYNLVRESVLSSGLDPHTPGLDMAARLRHEPGSRDRHRQQIALGTDRRRSRRGTDSISDAPTFYPARVSALLLASYRGRNAWQRLSPWLGLRPRHFRPVLPAVVEPRTGCPWGRARDHGQALADHTCEQDQLASRAT